MPGPKPRQSIDAAAMSKTNTIKMTTRFITTHLSFLETIIAIKSYPSSSGGVFLFPLLALVGGLLDFLERAEDHVLDNLWLRDHDHVGALGLGDRSPGALGHRTDGIGAHHFVAARDHRPRWQLLPGRNSRRLREHRLGEGALGGGHQGALLHTQVEGKDLMEFFGIDRKLCRRLLALSGRVLQRN